MTPTDSRLQSALDAATAQIATTLTAVAGRVSEALGNMAQASVKIAERDLLISSQFDLRRNSGVLMRVFGQEMMERIAEELAPRDDTKRKLGQADWQTLSLVDDTEMEERMYSDRIGQMISHACDAELRELAAYMGALLQIGRADQDRNPLRADVIGTALYRAIEAVTSVPETRKLFARELGGGMAKAMPDCYALILTNLQNRGVQPVSLTVRQVEGPGNQLPGLQSGYGSLNSTRSQHGDLDSQHSGHGNDSGLLPRGWRSGGASAGGNAGAAHATATRGNGPGVDGGAVRGAAPAHSQPAPAPYASSQHAAHRASQYGAPGHAASASSGPSGHHATDMQLMTLLRQLTAVASRSGELDAAARSGRTSGAGRLGTGFGRGPSDGVPSSQRGDIGVSEGDSGHPAAYAADGLTGLMAVNLIRAHREELMQASGGKLDHMVIDVVGSLFDQILSDTRVPPQMARQIARLQLPVLRVALSDESFFSSRRHPVRRFVNRIASLACAFDDFDEGPGKLFIDRVRALVQEIVDGDFDQIDTYSTKLAALEAFIVEQTDSQVEQRGAAVTLRSKETELRLQQRYMLQLQAQLAPMALPDYLRDFLAQVWSQALVLATSRDGIDSDRAKRYRRAGRDLVMSIQPKGAPALRKKFLMQLPPLMKDLNEGLQLIGWPDNAQRAFFAKLMPAHAESLKSPPQSELDHNMMAKQLENIFGAGVPGSETLSMADPVPEVDAEVLAQRFTPEEAERVGLVTESAVDWAGPLEVVDIDLSADPNDTGMPTSSLAGHPSGDSMAASLSGSEPRPESGAGELPVESDGGLKIDHIKLGFAYQMHLKDEWQKVRLAHVSAGRSFFVFTSGRKHQETISMTSRMLARMCETRRLRAVESAYLMERATHRARKQLAALSAATRH